MINTTLPPMAVSKLGLGRISWTSPWGVVRLVGIDSTLLAAPTGFAIRAPACLSGFISAHPFFEA
jgi:hypothetical protein